MSRVAAPLKCKEDEINSLNEILNSSVYNDDMKRRASIILLANDGMPNKEIAKKLDSNENTVAMWRNRFIKNGIAGLSDLERPGRRGSKGENKRAAVIEAARQNDSASVSKLAEEAGTSDSTVRRALNEAGITAGNKRTYEINANSELNKVCADIKGLYISNSALAIVLRIDNTLSSTLDEGTVTSRNRELALAAEDNSSLTDVLDLMCTKKKETAVKEVGLDEFLKKTDDSLNGETKHVAIIYSSRYKLPQGFIAKNMNMISIQDEASWHACISTCLNVLSYGDTGKHLFNSLTRYIHSRTEGEEAFVWTRKTLSFDRSVRQDVINPSEISIAFADDSVNNVAWVKYGYATRDGEYAEFTDTRENILPKRDGMIYGDPLRIASYTGDVVSGVRSLFAAPQKKLAEEYMNGGGKKKRLCEIETMIGRLQITIDEETSKILSSRERLWEPSFKQLVFSLVTDVSYHKAPYYTNTFLFRTIDELKVRTLEDAVNKTGEEVTEFRNSLRTRILKENGFNPETGELEDSSKLPECITAPRPEHSEEELALFAEEIEVKVKDYNESHSTKIIIPIPEIIDSLEVVPEDAVIVCIDEVGVKHQKEYRKEERKEEAQKTMSEEDIKLENAENVETAVAYIRSSEGTYRIAEKTISAALLTVLAYLLNNKILSDRRLLFFTDGARNLKTSIEKIFSFRPFTINLDWIHVKSYCYQLLTMAMRGGKENLERNERLRKAFFEYLWVGDVQGAKDYLDTLDSSCIKNPGMLKSIKNYLDRKRSDEKQKYFYCYQMRKELELINSSNQGEKSNDMIIAQRQKHNGMSWVVNGSANLGHISELHVNNEEENWYRTGQLSFTPVKLSEQIVQKYHYQA